MPAANGFSLAETLLVLLMACILMVLVPGKQRQIPLDLFMEELESEICSVQALSFARKESQEIGIQERKAILPAKTVSYPDSVSCTPFSFGFNARGNITKGGSVTCTNGQVQQKMVFQIGAGRIRHE